MIFCNPASHQRFPRRTGTSCPSRTVCHLWWDAERASWEGCRCAGRCRHPRGRTRSPIRVVEQVLRLEKPVLSRHLDRTALFNKELLLNTLSPLRRSGGRKSTLLASCSSALEHCGPICTQCLQCERRWKIFRLPNPLTACSRWRCERRIQQLAARFSITGEGVRRDFSQ